MRPCRKLPHVRRQSFGPDALPRPPFGEGDGHAHRFCCPGPEPQLPGLDVEHDLPRALPQITSAAKALLGVDGAGLMLADECGQLRWATASDQQTQVIEEGEERPGQGPCVNAFAEHAPMAMRDAAKEPQWGKIIDVVTGQAMRASLSVPVQLEGGPIGTLDLYSAQPRDWDQAEISAAQVYAVLAATLLSQAVGAQVKGRLAEQLQTAFAHRTRIERQGHGDGARGDRRRRGV